MQAPLPHGGPHGTQALCQVPFHVDLAGDVGLGETEFAGLPQQPAQRAPGAYDDHGGVGGTGLTAVPGAQPYRQGAAERIRGECGEPLCGTGADFGAGGRHRAESSLMNRYCWTSR